MFKPNFQRTDSLIEMIARIEVARDRIPRARIVPRWEAKLRREAVARSAHHSTSIECNPLSLEEVTDLLTGRDVLAHAPDKQEVLNYADVLRYMDRLSELTTHELLVVEGDGRATRYRLAQPET